MSESDGKTTGNAAETRDRGFDEIAADIADGGYRVASSPASSRAAPRFRPLTLFLAAFVAANAAGIGSAQALDCVSPTHPHRAYLSAVLTKNPTQADLLEARQSMERRFDVRFDDATLKIAPSPSPQSPGAVKLESGVCGKPESISSIRTSAWMIRMVTGAHVEVFDMPTTAGRSPNVPADAAGRDAAGRDAGPDVEAERVAFAVPQRP